LKRIAALNWLIPLIVITAAVAALLGLFASGGDGRSMFTTVHGQTVEIYGKGLYRFDTVFSAATFKGVDVITLVVSLPLLIIAFALYRRNSLRGGVLLLSALPYFIYIGASMTFSAAFNRIFLLYAALFSISLFTFITLAVSIDLLSLSKSMLPRLPRRGIAIFMFIAGIGTFLLWLSELIGPMMTGAVPANLGPYTTMFTHGFDSALITPATVLTGIYLLRRRAVGYLFAAPLLVFCVQNGLTVIAATVSQTLEGITFPLGVYIGMIGSWVVMGTFALVLAIQFFRNFSTTNQKIRKSLA
jgi:hypothetical protein